jgi:hypothetical protein
LRDDRDRVGVVRVLRLRNDQGRERDVFPAAERVSGNLLKDVLAVGRADDADVPVAEELDACGDGVPYFRVVQFGIGGTVPSSVTQMRPY